MKTTISFLGRNTIFTLGIRIVGAVGAITPIAFADTWTGGSTVDALWQTPENWGGTAPTPGVTTDLTFDGSARTVCFPRPPLAPSSSMAATRERESLLGVSSRSARPAAPA